MKDINQSEKKESVHQGFYPDGNKKIKDFLLGLFVPLGLALLIALLAQTGNNIVDLLEPVFFLALLVSLIALYPRRYIFYGILVFIVISMIWGIAKFQVCC